MRFPTLIPWLLPCALLAVAPAARADMLELPFERDLGAITTLRVVLDTAEVDVVLDAEAPQSLRAVLLGQARATEVDAEGARLVLQTRGGPPTLGRVDGDPPRRLRVELVLHPETELEVVGRELTITAESARVDEPPRDGATSDAASRRRTRTDRASTGGRSKEEELALEQQEQEAATARGGLRLRVVGSSVDLYGVEAPRVESDDGFVALQATAGRAVVTANGGTVTVSDHRGSLDLLGTDVRATVDGLLGDLKLDALGGSVDVLGGVGASTLTAEEGSLRVTRRSGAVTADVDGASLELADLGDLDDLGGGQLGSTGAGLAAGRASALRLTGRSQSRIQLDRVDSLVQVQLEGGSLEVAELRGRLELQSRGSEVAVRDVQARVRVEQVGGDVEIVELRGSAELELTDLALRLDAVERLSLQGSGLDVSGGDLETVTRFDLERSSIDLDLTSFERQRLDLRVVGDSDVSLDLPMPCVVQFRSDEALEDEGVDVAGCDLRLPEQPLVSVGARRRYGRLPLTATIQIDAGVELRVRGR